LATKGSTDGLTREERAARRADFTGRFSADLPSANNVGRISSVRRYAGIIADAERVIADRLPDLLESALLLATGKATEEAVTVKGELVVRRLAPDTKAIMYLMDRLMGKPINVTQMEISGEVKHTGVTIHLTPHGPPQAIAGAVTPLLPAFAERELPTLVVKDVKRRGRRTKPKVVKEETDAAARSSSPTPALDR